MTATTEFKVRENRLRAAAKRQGLVLEKCRVRDPRGVGYGLYRLRRMNVHNSRYGTYRPPLEPGVLDFTHTLDDIEQILKRPA